MLRVRDVVATSTRLHCGAGDQVAYHAEDQSKLPKPPTENATKSPLEKEIACSFQTTIENDVVGAANI
jgi:hypothetical protein